MGNAFQSELKRWDVIAGLLQSNGFKHLVNVDPHDGRVANAVHQHMPELTFSFDWMSDDKEVDAMFAENTNGILDQETSDQPDMVFIEGHDANSVRKHIQHWFPRLKDGGVLAIGNYKHQEGIPVMRAVADMFPLYAVNVFPDNVAVVTK